VTFRSILAAAGVATILMGPNATAQTDVGRTFLNRAFSMGAPDLTRIDAGQVVARTLDAKHRREVATLGVVRIRTTPATYVERLTDIVNFKRNENVLQIGTFSNPPQLADVAALSLEEADVKRLRDCQVGDCDVKLSAEAIGRFRREVDWRAADAPQRAASLFRQLIVDYVAQYRKFGPAAAMEYADTDTHMNTEREFTALALAEPSVWGHVPALRKHLFEFPAVDSARSHDLVYWSKERVNGKPVISVTHVAIVREDEGRAVQYAIATKQIYAMHYFDASLGLTLLAPDTKAAMPAIYVVYLNRSRIDLFGNLFGGVARKIVAGRARSLVADLLARVQKSMELPLPQGGPGGV
jgi:hypothetical protein